MELLNTLNLTIDRQERAQQQEYDDIMRLQLKERVDKGYTICNVPVEFAFYDDLPNNWCRPLPHPYKYLRSATIRNDNNISKFREGMQVVLSCGQLKFKMEIVSDGVNLLVLQPNQYEIGNCVLDVEHLSRDNWEINIDNQTVTHKLLRSAMNLLASDSGMCRFIEELLGGTLKNTYDETIPVKRSSGNESQNEAINKALSCSHFHLIQGPPGTGKTFTVAKIVSFLLEQGKNVFVTGPTHTSINNCLNAISSDIKDKSRVVKVGERYQADEIIDNLFVTRVRSLKFSDYKYKNDLSKNGIAIGATPYALCYPASKKLQGWRFDYVVIDEAAQMGVPLSLSAVLSGDKTIFVGDQKQLDPIVMDDDKSGNSMGSSIFSRLTQLYPDNITLLNKSYRLNNELIRIPNKLFYDGRLSSERAVDKPFVNFRCKLASAILNNESSELLVLHHVFDSLGRSPFEAGIVADIVSDLVFNGVKFSDIGIISPYRAQVREVKRTLVARKIVQEQEIDTLFIDTVERMQGQEKAYIIYSMSNSNPAEAAERSDFFYSPNRLNVAITRAFIKNIVIANEKVFDFCREHSDKSYSLNQDNADKFIGFYDLSTKIHLRDDVEDDEW